jgi:tetratricopeptide (TPR) repeat protein
VPGLAAAGVFVAWGAIDGGFLPRVWYPGALFLLGLLVVALLAYPPMRRGVPAPAIAALAFFACFTLWSFLSLTWADMEDDAWDGANRTLLYLAVYALFALWPWQPRAAALVLGAFAVSAAVLGLGSFLLTIEGADPATSFVDGRLNEPLGYHNGNGAFFLAAFWPAAFLASRKELPLLARAILLAAAGLLIELAVLPQSRGSLFALPVVLVAYLLLVPGRVRALLWLLPPAAALLLTLDPLLDVFGAVRDGTPAEALREAREALVVSTASLFALGLAFAFADRRVQVPDRIRRLAGRGLAAAAALGAAAGLVYLAVTIQDPGARISDAWSELKAGQTETADTHFGAGLGTNRYDFWRVAVGEFADAPVRGIGADNFAVAYLRERRTGEEPLYPHSLELRVLSQTGLVGTLLFTGFLLAALAAAWRARRRAETFGRGVAAVAVVAFGYWLVHGSVDWFWEIPALGAPAFAWLGLAAGLAPREEDRAAPGFLGRRPLCVGLAVVSAVLAVGAATSNVLPWLSARAVAHAAETWGSEPEEAFDSLERARSLNPLSDRPDLVAGAIAMRLDDLSRARACFTRALARNPIGWYAELELAIIASIEGREQEARSRLERARRLNPREPAIALVGERVRAGRPVSPDVIDRLFLERLEERWS